MPGCSSCSVDAAARAVWQDGMAVCNRREGSPDSQICSPTFVSTGGRGEREHSRPRRKDPPPNPMDGSTAGPQRGQPLASPRLFYSSCVQPPSDSAVPSLTHPHASGDGRAWPWPGRSSLKARSAAENRLSNGKRHLHAIRSSAWANGFSATLCQISALGFPAWGMPAQEKEEAFRNRCEAAAQLTVTLDLRYVSRRM